MSRCRAELAEAGVTQLVGFLRDAAVTETVAAAVRLRPRAWATASSHNVYFTDFESDRCGADPASRPIDTSEKALAYDLLVDLPIRRVYESDALLEFVRQVLDVPQLHCSADPLDAAQIAFFETGDQLGGQFEFLPALRSATDSNHRGVLAALDGARDGVHTLTTSPGTLALFRGHWSLHRVAAVTGNRPRINSVFTFGERPGMRLTPLTQKLFYGRNVN